jgi:hypothetical protein
VSRLILDAGAFIALERDDRRAVQMLAEAHRRDLDVITVSPIIAQVWRSPRTQVVLARVLRGVRVIPPTEADALRCGELLAKTRTSDVVDGLLVCLGQHGDLIATSDHSDIRLLANKATTRLTIVSL